MAQASSPAGETAIADGDPIARNHGYLLKIPLEVVAASSSSLLHSPGREALSIPRPLNAATAGK
jgi:hypothetical protein